MSLLLNRTQLEGRRSDKCWRRIDGNVNEQSTSQTWYLPGYDGNENKMKNTANKDIT